MLRILCVSRRWLLFPVLLGMAGACAPDRLVVPEDSTAVAETVVVANLPAMAPGTSQRLVARIVRGRDTLTATDVSWSTDDARVATISDGNLLTAVSTGTTYVSADRRGRKGRAQVQVTSVAVASVRLEPGNVNLLPGGQASVTATPLDASGAPIAGRTVSWTSSDPNVATVSGGTVVAVRTGSASIAATVDGVVATGSVVVSPAPVASVVTSLNAPSIAVAQTVQASATPRDANGAALTGRAVTWSSSNPAVATVNASGLVTGVGPGSTIIRATSEGVTGDATLSVVAQTVSSIVLQPAAFTLQIGAAQAVGATLRDAAGNAIAGRQPAWSSTNTAIATVAADGRVTAVSIGTTTITATADGASAAATVTVVPVGEPVPSITPSSLALTVGGSGTLAAQMRDGAGNVIAATFSWTSSDAGVAGVDATGRVTGVSAGTATITASADGRSASATVTVSPVPVASVGIAPGSLSLVAGATGQLTATCRDAAGNALTGRTVTWGSNATGVAIVNAVGLVTAISAGSTTIVATCDGRTASVPVTVSAVPVASVTVTPGSGTVQVGSTLQLAATPRDAAGNSLPNRTVTWSSSNPAVATVSASGLVTAVAAGSASIVATAEGVTGSAAVTVPQPVTLVRIELTPGTASLSAGATQQFTAIGRRSDNTTQAVSVTYTATAGTISSGGMYTAPTTGGTYSVVARIVGGTFADTSSVTVTPPVTTPPDATCGNQPAGYAQAMDTPWQALPALYPAFSSEGWRYYPNQANTLELVNDPSGPRSPGSTLRINYPQGFGGGSAPSRFGGRDLPANSGNIYVCAWFRFSAGYDNNGNNGTKLFFIRGYPTENTLNHFVGTQGMSTRLTMITGLQAPSQGVNYGGTGTESELTGGTWKKIEVLWEANVPGQNNGRLRHWINGQLVFSSDAVRFFDAGQTARWDYVWFDPTYGGGYNPVPRLQWQEYDHFYVAVR